MYEVAEVDSEKVMSVENSKVGGNEERECEIDQKKENVSHEAAQMGSLRDEPSNAASCTANEEEENASEGLMEETSASLSQDNNKKQRNYKLFNRFGKRKINVSKKTKGTAEEEIKGKDNDDENSLPMISETSKEDIKDISGGEEMAKDEENQTPPPLPPKMNRFKWKRSGIPVKVNSQTSSKVTEEEEVTVDLTETGDAQFEKEEPQHLEDSKPQQENEESTQLVTPDEQHVESEVPQPNKNESASGGRRKFTRKIPRAIRMKRKNKEAVEGATDDVDEDAKTQKEDDTDQTMSKQGREKRKKFHWRRFSMLSTSKESEEQDTGKTGEPESSTDEQGDIGDGPKLLIPSKARDECETKVVDQNSHQEDAEVSTESQNQDYQAESPDQSNDVDDTLEASSLTHVTQMLEKEEEITEKSGYSGKNPFLADRSSSPDDLVNVGEAEKDVETKEEDSQINQESTSPENHGGSKSDKVTDFILVDPYTEKPKDDSFYLTKKALRVYQKAQLSQNYCQACCTLM